MLACPQLFALAAGTLPESKAAGVRGAVPPGPREPLGLQTVLPSSPQCGRGSFVWVSSPKHRSPCFLGHSSYILRGPIQRVPASQDLLSIRTADAQPGALLYGFRIKGVINVRGGRVGQTRLSPDIFFILACPWRLDRLGIRSFVPKGLVSHEQVSNRSLDIVSALQ